VSVLNVVVVRIQSSSEKNVHTIVWEERPSFRMETRLHSILYYIYTRYIIVGTDHTSIFREIDFEGGSHSIIVLIIIFWIFV